MEYQLRKYCAPHYLILAALLLSSCTATPTINVSSGSTLASPTPSPSATTPVSARAVKIIFKIKSSGVEGSFAAPSSTGTTPTPGSGLQATRIYNADGTLLASTSDTTSWPAWFSSFELGISGSSNTSSGYANCANFSEITGITAGESSSLNCNIGPTPSPSALASDYSNCGAPSGVFRVSEADCSIGSPITSAGNGGPSDGVYMRANFSRDTSALGSHENILVILEYAASSLTAGPTTPSLCFSGGNFTPEKCSDFVWKAYLKHSTSEVVQPYMILIPPTFSSVLSPNRTTPASGVTTVTKQFILPFSGDSGLTTLQISRVGSYFPGSTSTAGTAAANLISYCTTAGGGLPGNSPLCAGVVFYSIMFVRI